MFCPAIGMGIEKAVLADVSLCRQDDEGQEDKGGKKRVEEQHGDDSVRLQRFLFEDIIEAEEGGGQECKD